ncbi:hypothetical protein GOP47_0021198 [Adiantum capillus-veneris]|uniref:FAS1 domain-containing protein n=1 Tax=Adiantum capillus-veneris TaxID=13818 RepID=A0A9D4UAN3_ADICA|nr:hypothetical protein GOP47_0021198 [Adiantum capillus-veneris]
MIISTMRLPAFLIISMLCCIDVTQAQLIIPNQVVSTLISALKDKGRYNTGALLVPYLKGFFAPPMTLLIPTDEAIAAQRIQESQLVRIAQFHMIKSNFSFEDLQLLPVNTFLPTFLLLDSSPARVEVTNNSADNYMLNNAQIVDKDICPQSVATFVSCQGISQILTSPETEAPAPAPASAPMLALAPSSALITPLVAPSPASGLLPIQAPGPASSESGISSSYSLHAKESVRFLQTIMCISYVAFKWLL